MTAQQVIYKKGKEIYVVKRYFVGKQKIDDLILKLIFGEIKKLPENKGV